jgi:hypothetical protein
MQQPGVLCGFVGEHHAFFRACCPHHRLSFNSFFFKKKKNRYGTCVDVNECTAHARGACDVESEICVNLPGRYKCVCRWGYTLSAVADRRVCVPDAAVKRAEIRLVPRYGLLSRRVP